MIYDAEVEGEKAWQKMRRSLQGDGFTLEADGDPNRFQVAKGADTAGLISFCATHKTAVLTIPEAESPARRHLRGWATKQHFMEVVGDDPACQCKVHRLSVDVKGE